MWQAPAAMEVPDMPRFSANLSTMFQEHPFLDRFEAAKKAGFDAVEFQFPYAFTISDIAARVRDLGLEVILFNLPPGDFARGERGIACHPGREAEFRDGIGQALDYAGVLACKTMNCLAGLLPEDVSRAAAQATLLGNLSAAASALAESGVQLVIEPINSYDMPRFLVNRSSEALQLMDQLKPHDVKLQYDVYHMQRMEGELFQSLTRLLPRIGHIQIADNPGRNEPGSGEINFPNLFRHLDQIGYAGWVGCEYTPKAGTLAGLGWRESMGLR
jgi:hydroxypyruvate isomerase